MSFSANLDDLVSANRNGLLSTHPSWARVRLSDIAAILNGAPFDSERFSKDQGIPLLRIRDVTNATTDAKYDGPFDPQYWVDPGDLVVGMDGDFKCALWRGPRALLNQRVCKLTPDERFYLRRFLVLALPGYLSSVNDHTSSITVKHLSSRTVGDIPLPLPPLPEQRRIVEALETHFTRLDAAVATLERVRANLKRYRASVLQAAVEGRLVEGDVVGWEVARVEQLGTPAEPTVTTGPFGTSLGSADFVATGVPLLTIGCLTHAGLRAEKALFVSEQKADSLCRYRLRAGDLLFSRMATVGRAGLVDDRFEGALFNYHIMRLRLDHTRIDPRYFLCYVRGAPAVVEYVRAVNHGATRDGINTEQLLGMPVRLPPMDVQRRIVEEVERLSTLIDDCDANCAAMLSRCTRLRQSILRLAFDGRLVPQDLRDESASVLLDRIRAERAAAASPTKQKSARSRR